MQKLILLMPVRNRDVVKHSLTGREIVLNVERSFVYLETLDPRTQSDGTRVA